MSEESNLSLETNPSLPTTSWENWGDFSWALSLESPFLWLFLCAAFILAMLALAWYGSRSTYHVKSPYSDLPMRTVDDLSYDAIGKMYLYLTGLREYDNRMFPLSSLLICRETGRIFPNAKNWLGRPHLDWGFLNKRYPGHYVSWGSLTLGQKQAIYETHESLEGFQTAFSSPNPAPSAITPPYALTKPGPLYVDLETYVLIGWKMLPGTELELLIVQKPLQRHALGSSNGSSKDSSKGPSNGGNSSKGASTPSPHSSASNPFNKET